MNCPRGMARVYHSAPEEKRGQKKRADEVNHVMLQECNFHHTPKCVPRVRRHLRLEKISVNLLLPSTKKRIASRRIACALILAAAVASGRLNAQHLTLEGQTGGFLTPTAYVVYSEKGQFFSHPAFGYHFINSSKVIGDIQTFSVAEGFANRAEVGYTRSVHLDGDGSAFSSLWNYSGMNIISGKVVVLKDEQFAPWTPGLAAGLIVRTGDHFVSGHLKPRWGWGRTRIYERGYVCGDD